VLRPCFELRLGVKVYWEETGAYQALARGAGSRAKVCLNTFEANIFMRDMLINPYTTPPRKSNVETLLVLRLSAWLLLAYGIPALRYMKV
jgi:hypothetical protein